jgi:chondroitin 4-sulfotransferase 11
MQYIFVHIPKTAGINTINYFKREKGNVTTSVTVINHVPTYIDGIIDISKLNIMNKNINFDTSFLFTFVRNPYNRVMSAYNYLFHSKTKTGLHLPYKKIIAKYQKSNDHNETFLLFMKDIETHKKTIVHFVPQYEFITHNDEILVNYVGKFENYENDMKALFPQYVNTGIVLNKSEQIIKELTSETKKIIYNAYKKDFELFGYSE